MDLSIQPIFANLDNPMEVVRLLRQIPDGYNHRSELGPGREYWVDGYDRKKMMGYYVRSDGKVASCLIIRSLYAYQHQLVSEYFHSLREGKTTMGLKPTLELALGLTLDKEIDDAIEQIEKDLMHVEPALQAVE